MIVITTLTAGDFFVGELMNSSNQINAQPIADYAFSTNNLNRNAQRRGDQTWFENLKRSKNARFVLCSDNKIVILDEGNSQRIFFDQSESEHLHADWTNSPYLGSRENLDYFTASALDFNEEARSKEKFHLLNLRALALEATIPDQDLSILAQASALNHWHSSHKFCASCGHSTSLAEAGYRRDCAKCGGQHFPRTDPAVIMLVTDGEKCLLGSTGRFAEGMYSTLAGFVEPGESFENAVRREVYEESGIEVGRVEYQFSQPWPFPANIMIGCVAEAITTKISFDTDELTDCRWFSRDEIQLMSTNKHPEKLIVPPNISIASALISQWQNLD